MNRSKPNFIFFWCLWLCCSCCCCFVFMHGRSGKNESRFRLWTNSLKKEVDVEGSRSCIQLHGWIRSSDVNSLMFNWSREKGLEMTEKHSWKLPFFKIDPFVNIIWWKDREKTEHKECYFLGLKEAEQSHWRSENYQRRRLDF
jgi:hypothetical protein